MKTMQGVVQSAKTAQTAIVMVTRRWQHPLYKKYVKRTKNYACHVEAGLKIEEGDVVAIQECRPLSKTKKFKVLNKVSDKKVIAKIVEEAKKSEEKIEKKTEKKEKTV